MTPILRTMAQDILSIPGSLVPCERAFSGTKHTDTNSQNCLSSVHLGTIQIMKAEMLNQRELQKERKKAADQEKFQQWNEHELGPI